VRVDWSPRANWQLYFSGSNNADHQNEPYTGGTTGCCPTGSVNFLWVTPFTHTQPAAGIAALGERGFADAGERSLRRDQL
jgi:hypothetical protein